APRGREARVPGHHGLRAHDLPRLRDHRVGLLLPGDLMRVELPEPARLKRLCIALAILDEIVCPDWEGRYYSFDPKWAKGEQMASMRNGSGDDYYIGFGKAGVFVKGFDHESKMSPYQHEPPKLWPGLFDGVPLSLHRFRDEPAF